MIGWIFSGWLQIFNFPPKIEEAYAQTTDTYYGAYDSVNSTMTDPVNAGTDNEQYAYGGKNKLVVIQSWTGTAGSGDITRVEIYCQHYATTPDGNDFTLVEYSLDDWVSIGSTTGQQAMPDSESLFSFTITGDRSWNWTDIGNLEVRAVAKASAKQNFTDDYIDVLYIQVDYAPNDPPSLTVSTPPLEGATVTAGDSYNITYDLSDTEDEATVDFYYDTDGSGLDGVAITGCQDQAKGIGATCSWNTTDVTADDYYVYGIATDGVNSDVNDYSPGMITIQAAAAPTLTFTISDNDIFFGDLSTSAAKWADDTVDGSTSEVAGHTITASTNATNGYTITVNGNTLTSASAPSDTITALASTSDVTAGNGTEQFGIRLTASGGDGAPVSPYNSAVNNYTLVVADFPDVIASDANGDDVSTEYSVFYAANIAATTEAHTDYTSALFYIATGNF